MKLTESMRLTKSMKRLFLILLMPIPLVAQRLSPYVATTGTVSVTTSYAATLQQSNVQTCGPTGSGYCSLPVSFPSSSSNTAGGAANSAGAVVYCSAACTATILVNATAATATAGTVTPYSGSPAALVQFFTASNYSGGTSLGFLNIPAGVEYPIDMAPIFMPVGGNSYNVTILITMATGTAKITFYPLEQH